MFLVDTNVLAELARPKPSPIVTAWFRDQDAITISVISIEELAFGIARLPVARRAKLTTWMNTLLDTVGEIFDVTPAIARAAGEVRAKREAGGRRVESADMLIAATALVHGLVVATRNVGDFENCGVAIVDPFVP